MAGLGSCSHAIERMVPISDGVELLLGSRHDPRFGPVVAIGLGGVYTELLDDFAVGLAPMDEREAELLLRSLRGAPLLLGARGRPPSTWPPPPAPPRRSRAWPRPTPRSPRSRSTRCSSSSRE